jgi:restriction system protein
MAELVGLIVLVLVIYGIGELITKITSTRNRRNQPKFNKDIENWRSSDGLPSKIPQQRIVRFDDLPYPLRMKIDRRFFHSQGQYRHYNAKPLTISEHPRTEWTVKSDSFINRPYAKSTSINHTDLSIVAEVSNYSISDQLVAAINQCDKSLGSYPVSKPRPVGKLSPPAEPILHNISDLGDEDFFKYLKPQDKAALDAYLGTLYAEDKERYEAAIVQYRTATDTTEARLSKALANWEANAQEWDAACLSDKSQLEAFHRDISNRSAEQIVSLALRSAPFPIWVPQVFSTSYDEVEGILVIEHQFPLIDEIDWFKCVELRASISRKPLNAAERKKVAAEIYPLLTLAIAAIAINNVNSTSVKLIVINGWVDYRTKETGEEKRAFCSSLVAEASDIKKINLIHADPHTAFKMLKGVTTPSLELAPVAPKIRLNMNDDRFIEGKEVLQGLSRDENLASMDWEDFEHLCRQLFEKVFATEGATVSVTKASRDQGVDAIILDPDPIRGGKIVIQAKRYVNTVDVSAVRDLWGVVSHEGAMKGLLVTTSTFGPDSYAFAEGKPITLINGANLLHLLEAHGYKFRINLEEARQIQRDIGMPPFRKRNKI